jgi:hypothetical protein
MSGPHFQPAAGSFYVIGAASVHRHLTSPNPPPQRARC